MINKDSNQHPLQILSWGLRQLKFWNAKPITAPLVEIECGGVTTTLAQIKDLKTNPNFPQTSTHIDILLPEGYTYKPPINIRLLDKRENGLIPLVGKYVLTEFAKYVIGPYSGGPDVGAHNWAARIRADKVLLLIQLRVTCEGSSATSRLDTTYTVLRYLTDPAQV